MPTYHQPYTHTFKRAGRTYQCQTRRASSGRRKEPTWSRANVVVRLSEAYRVIEQVGGLTFTLRLHLDALICVTGAADPARVMSRRLQRAFERHGLPMPLMAFSLEVTPDDREELHLHGGIVPGDIARVDLVAILREAGGKIGGQAGARQVKLQAFNNAKGGPAGWARYPTKGAARTRRVIDHDRVIYISRELVQVAKQNWNERRASAVPSGMPTPSRSLSARPLTQPR